MRTIAPSLSAAHATGDKARLQYVVTQAARAISATAIAALIAVAIAGQWLIGVTFGEEFIPAYPALVLFCAGLAVKAYFGPVEVLMTMTRNEGAIVRGQVLALMLSLTVSLTLASTAGAVGVSLAAILGAWILTFVLWRTASRRLDCTTTALGR